MKLKNNILLLLLCAMTWQCCKKDPVITEEADIVAINFNPTNYQLSTPPGFPEFVQPSDNEMTVEGVGLGRALFHDPILSVDSTVSCSSCHLQPSSFTDDLEVSKGVDNALGRRSSMSLMNVAYYNSGLFWDGRRSTLEEQALDPILDMNEMANTWENVEEHLRAHPTYPFEFRKAFGITKRADIDRDMVAKAISQFERTMVSSGESKFDRFIAGQIGLEEDELEGYLIFFDLVPELPDGECGHCHSQPLFTTNEYFNNGIDVASTFEDFKDDGRGEVTNDPTTNGTFRIPTLRNITLTAPYMHDGRFQTLEEVMDHYNKGGELSPNKHPLISPLGLTDSQKESVIAFLHTLVDSTFTKNPALANPF